MDLSLFWGLLGISGVIFWGFIYGSHRRGNAKGQMEILYVVGSILITLVGAMLFSMRDKNNMPYGELIVTMFGLLIPLGTTILLLRRAVSWEVNLDEEDKKEAHRVASLSSTARAEEKAANDRAVEAERQKDSTRQYGAMSKTLVCPHCQTKGSVRKTNATRVTKSRVNSVAGRAIGLGTNSEQKVIQLHCDNCDVTWDVK